MADYKAHTKFTMAQILTPAQKAWNEEARMTNDRIAEKWARKQKVLR